MLETPALRSRGRRHRTARLTRSVDASVRIDDRELRDMDIRQTPVGHSIEQLLESGYDFE
jgi:hypothetical protein